IPQVDHDSSTIPDNKGDAKNTTASKDASQNDQIVIDGVPAVRLDDNATDFAALLDIIIPDRIPLTKPQYTFQQLSGVYKICEKYLIDDIRDWALLWLEDILPTSEMDISKVGEVYTSPSVAAKVIEFAQDANLPQFLPFAYYAMAIYPWSSTDGASLFFEVGLCLSAHDGYRIEVGRTAIQAEVLTGIFNALPDIGLPGRATCVAGTVNGGTCAKARRHAWSDPSKLIADVLKSPLEFLDRRVKIPPKKWEEIQTIESIFPDDVHKEISTAKAWKGASMPPSFTMRIAADDPELEQHIYITLHVHKTYPSAPATFTIKAPMGGLSASHLKTLTSEIHRKAQELSRNKQEMVFDIRQLCVDFMNTYHTYQKPSVVKPEAKLTPSLATEMQVRAASAERAQKVKAAQEADGQRQLEEERANRLANEMKRDTQRREQKIRAEQERKQARERFLDRSEQDDSIVKFDGGSIRLEDGRTFNAVKILMPHPCVLGTISAVEPILDSPSPSASSMLLDLHSFHFSPTYYSRSQGRKRLKEIESELQVLRGLSHPNLLKVYAAELKRSPEDGQVLHVLTERPPSLTLKEVLEQSDTLRPEKAVDYLIQILSGLAALASYQPDNNHERVRFCHRGVCLSNVGLTRDTSAKFGTKAVIFKAWYYGRLLSLHKSNPFDGISAYVEENPVPRQWLSRDAEDSPHVYNQRRDIWDAGIIMLQMLFGVDVMTQYPAVWNAVDALVALPITDSLRTTIANMFDQTKKNGLTCSELIAKLKEAARERPSSEVDNGTVVGSIGTGGPRSPISPVAPVRHTADYFYPSGSVSSLSMPPPRTSRYKEEWEEIEFLGKGGFGSVVKARLKLDGAIYAVKKIKLRGENDGKIYREVNALSRLNHRFIVRYHTTWIESTGVSGFESPTESGESSAAEMTNGINSALINGTSKPGRRRNGPIFRRELSLDDGSFSGSLNTSTSFPSIRFGHSEDGESDDENEDDEAEAVEQDGENDDEDGDGEDEEEDGNLTESVYPRSRSADAKKTFLIGNGTSSEDDTPNNSRAASRRSTSKKSPKSAFHSHFARAPQIMYIQMASREYVERQTLKEAIEDGLTEKDCWRLFRQILEALAHIASLGIIHRDVKLTNIFIGANGDVKIGDFGLATSSLAGIDPSDLSKTAFQPNLEITYGQGVGTALYTAPEVLSRARGNANHSKADMYSLGIVFFEMCWPPFQTSSERIEVLNKLRMPTVIFPEKWQDRERQRTIITKLLQHNPAQRPSALELSNSSLLPEQEEDAYFEEARRKIHNSDEQCETFIAELFQKKFDDVKQLSYDIGATPSEYSSLNDIVQDHMEQLFRLHGAVHKEPLILVPQTEVFDDEQQPVRLLDSAGRAVSLPRDLIVGFARLAVPSKDSRTPLRVKRFHVGNVYLPSPTGKQPIPRLMAVVDIIHTDNAAGAAEAELIRIVNEGLNLFPGVNSHQYEVLVSHSHIIDHLFGRITDRGRRRDAVLVLSQAKAFTQKRPHLLKLGLPRMLIDEMEILSEDIEPEDASE
ncbi:hypothetical protein FRB90_002076, partial [Tulasnella sp. 427]